MDVEERHALFEPLRQVADRWCFVRLSKRIEKPELLRTAIIRVTKDIASRFQYFSLRFQCDTAPIFSHTKASRNCNRLTARRTPRHPTD